MLSIFIKRGIMNFRKLILAAVILIFSFSLTAGQNTPAKKIVIMPFVSEGIDNITLNSAEVILRLEISKLSKDEIIVGKDYLEKTDSNCAAIDCAVAYGKQIDADQVVACNFLVLGQKIIIQYTLYDVAENKAVIDDSIISMSIEELDVVMKRIAMSLTRNESAKETAEKGVIIGQEAKKTLLRSGGNFYGFSLGYLFPLTGFNETERSFTIDLKVGSELEDFDYGLQFAARQGFGVNIYSSCLLTKEDVCPYIGAGLGFHWITGLHKNDSYYDGTQYIHKQDDRKEDGFELLLNSGFRFFNTYDMKITINFTFAHTFNDYKSDSFVLTIGYLR